MKSIIICAFALFGYAGFCQTGIDSLQTQDRRIMAMMRQLGHELLLSSQDHHSRVLPVKKEENRFVITMENHFSFDPGRLAGLADSLLSSLSLRSNYLLEAVQCTTGEIVYSYELSEMKPGSDAPCGGRVLPRDCYILSLTLLPQSLNLDFFPFTKPGAANTKPLEKKSWTKTFWLIPAVFILIGFLIYQRKRPDNSQLNPNVMHLGNMTFDKSNLLLHHEGKNIELSGKETDVLYLLLTSANQTVDREKMLRDVWGNDGDYIGRTLDVFISKLRKKLEPDESIKIVNIRGVGYKLVLEALPS